MKRNIKKEMMVLAAIGALAVSPLDVNAAEMTSVNTIESVARFMHTYTETITVVYPSPGSVPNSYYYEYYNSSMGIWYRGTLAYVKQVPNKDGTVTATFSGTMYGQNM